MGLAAGILLCVLLGALIAGSVLRRLGVAWGAWISFFGHMLAKLTGGLVVAWTAVEAAERGGGWYGVLATTLGVLSLGMFVLVGLLAWAALKYGVDTED